MATFAYQAHISANIQQHIDWLKQYVDLGFEKIILHNVGRNQEEFLNMFGEKVLPKLWAKEGFVIIWLLQTLVTTKVAGIQKLNPNKIQGQQEESPIFSNKLIKSTTKLRPGC